jgi:peptide/nickel transport system substrate-binding protein/oligopeptide transport system substrate-binding protein
VTLLDAAAATLIYNGLMRFDLQGHLVPDLAARMPERSADGLTYRFELRRGVRFHNGRELTAADVVYSFRRVLDPATLSPRAWVLDSLAGARSFRRGQRDDLPGVYAEGRHGLVITLERPLAHFLSLLAMPAAFIVDRAEVERHQDPADYGFHPVGTGPWILEEWLPGAHLRFRANLDYFEGRPHLDRLEYRVIEDAATARAEFVAGNLDRLRLTPGDSRRFREDPRWRDATVAAPDLAVFYLGLNCEKPPLSDARVRKAINHAIDREAILKAVLPDRHVPANGSVPPGLEGHDPAMTGWAYDPQLARRLLAEAGFPRGFRMEILQTSSPGVLAITEPIQSMLARVGIKARIVQLETAAFFAAVGDQGNPDAFFISWWADIPDAENFLYPLFHSRNRGSGGNRSRFADPVVDRLLETARATMDPTERIAMYREIERRVFDEAPWVPLYFPVNYSVYQPWVRGYLSSPVATAQKLTGVWFEPEAAPRPFRPRGNRREIASEDAELSHTPVVAHGPLAPWGDPADFHHTARGSR